MASTHSSLPGYYCSINTKKSEQMDLAWSLYEQLKGQGLEVIIDDRDERAGVKFKDADLTVYLCVLLLAPRLCRKTRWKSKKDGKMKRAYCR
jgi:prolyl-tRNA synthetase